MNEPMAGDADDPLAVSPPATAARLPPPWFDDDAERAAARYARQLAGMRLLEKAAIAAGYNVRSKCS